CSLCSPSALCPLSSMSLFSTHSPPSEISTLSLHDALPILIFRLPLGVLADYAGRHKIFVILGAGLAGLACAERILVPTGPGFLRSEEHTSELQSRFDLVCRLLLEKKKTRHRTR